MKIRRVSGADDALLRLQRRALPQDEPISTKVGWWWLAMDGDDPVAFAGSYQSSRWLDAIYLCRAGVLASHRGQGLQKRLIKAREQHARSIGMNWLITDTTDNPASANSLIGCGFRLYEPAAPWAGPTSLYWRKRLKNRGA